jgi:beta-glucosidase/6-phospho-beta-glucosidase/beta-galactosidase
MPAMFPSKFIFATGVENSYPTIQTDSGRKRIDEMESCRHYKNWKTDFQLAKDLGVSHLRYGPPYYKTHLGPGRYDWSFADEVFAELKKIELHPIVDLCHFGVPDWIGNFQNPDFPNYFAEYAEAFARRYNWVRWYTPINEIYVAAVFSGQFGWWNECLKSDHAFVTALKHLARANVQAMRAILKQQSNAVFVQSESSEYYHPRSPDCLEHTHFLNARRFLALDLSYGHQVDAKVYQHLIDNGMTRDEYNWFAENHVKAFCVMGTDYYATNEHLVDPNGSYEPSGEIFGYYVITKEYYDRYHLPVMHTETNVLDDKRAPQWLYKEWENLYRLRQDGIPIIGFTWYSLTDQMDWDSRLVDDAGHVNPCGLYDLNRKIRPVGEHYRRLIKEWRDILPTGSTGLNVRSKGEAQHHDRENLTNS